MKYKKHKILGFCVFCMTLMMSVIEMAKMTNGYPFAFQVLGYMTYDAAKKCQYCKV